MPCSICEERNRLREQRKAANGNRRCCDDCGRPFPEYPGWGRNGFQAQTIDHFHEEPIDNSLRRLKVPVMKELCLTCYRKDQIANNQTPLFDPPYAEIELDRLHELPKNFPYISSKGVVQVVIPTTPTPDKLPATDETAGQRNIPDHLKDYLAFQITTVY